MIIKFTWTDPLKDQIKRLVADKTLTESQQKKGLKCVIKLLHARRKLTIIVMGSFWAINLFQMVLNLQVLLQSSLPLDENNSFKYSTFNLVFSIITLVVQTIGIWMHFVNKLDISMIDRYKTMEDFYSQQIHTTHTLIIARSFNLFTGIVGAYAIIPHQEYFKLSSVDMLALNVMPYLLMATVLF